MCFIFVCVTDLCSCTKMDSATMLFSSVWDKAPHIVAEVYSHYIAFAKTGLGSLPGNLPTSLTELYLFWTAIPKLVLLIGHSIACVTMAPDVKTHFLLHFWLTYLGGSGGGLLSSVLMMVRGKVVMTAVHGLTASVTCVPSTLAPSTSSP